MGSTSGGSRPLGEVPGFRPNGGQDGLALRRTDFPVRREIPTRWSDVDVYGHLNNAVHYAMFDTAVNAWLIEATGTDTWRLRAIGVVVETSCRYFAALGFPEPVTAGLAVEQLGNRSVVYRPALFGDRDEPAKLGRFVHVYVDATTRHPVPVPPVIRRALQTLSSAVSDRRG